MCARDMCLLAVHGRVPTLHKQITNRSRELEASKEEGPDCRTNPIQGNKGHKGPNIPSPSAPRGLEHSAIGDDERAVYHS